MIHDPQHTLDIHPVIAPRRASLIQTTNDQRRNPVPCRIAQNQPVHNAQDRLPPKATLMMWTPLH